MSIFKVFDEMYSPAPISGNEAKIDSLAKKRDHAADVLGKPLLALSYQQEIDALLATSGNDEVEAMCKELEGYLYFPTDDDDRPIGPVGPDPVTNKAAALLRKLAEQVEVQDRLLAGWEEKNAVGDAVAPVASEEVEAMCERLEAITIDVGLGKLCMGAAALLRKLDAERAQYQTAFKDAERWREHAKCLKAATLPDSLHIRMTVGYGEKQCGIEKVLSTLELGASVLGVRAVGLTAEGMFQELDAAIAKEGK